MEADTPKNGDSLWVKQEIDKIQSHFVSELHRIEGDFNEHFTALNNEFQVRQPKLSEIPLLKKSTREIKESRIFIPRNSVLTDLFQISHIQTLRNVFAATLIILFLHDTIEDIVNDGRLNLRFDVMFESFGKLHIALFIWLIMQLATSILVFFGVYCWANSRNSFKKNLKAYDMAWLFLYISYLIIFLILPCHQIEKHQFPVASALIVLLEQMRQMMKAHSFVRENIRKNLLLIESKNASVCPDYSKYLYFLFAPTLIYKDEYPRTTTIHWDYVLRMFGQVLASAFYAYYVVERFCLPIFSDLSQNEITLPIFISVLFNSIMPGSLFLLLIFYGFLHCWLNAFAEMLRFADRMFYQDWWNSTTFANYYRTWNVVVHDWLHAYVYRELYVLMGKKNRAIPSICVILLSAVFHEYVMYFALGFFYPVMFILFGVVGLAFLFLIPRNPGPVFNIMIWLFLFIGIGLETCFYFMESFARKICPPSDLFWDKIMPRSFVCHIVSPASKLLRVDL
ncbi:unnamed protein product [Adineta steineri]|uniref:O-acyltransferase n=1 Tax=Adineta steineri TaxID=433720 RepID=A0A819TGI1_9BILA|nr:unnamed protein product [Adineta steineri]